MKVGSLLEMLKVFAEHCLCMQLQVNWQNRQIHCKGVNDSVAI